MENLEDAEHLYPGGRDGVGGKIVKKTKEKMVEEVLKVL